LTCARMSLRLNSVLLLMGFDEQLAVTECGSPNAMGRVWEPGAMSMLA
jgi:hypothetical protein